jgi:hypothetical protein
MEGEENLPVVVCPRKNVCRPPSWHPSRHVPDLLHSVEILGIDLDATRVETGFVTLMTLPTEAKAILAFSGTTIAFRNLDGAVKLLDTTRPLCEVKLDYPQPDLPVNQVCPLLRSL